MISKAEALQKLKKMGVMVADDNSIVTILIPADISFETGLRDVRRKLADIGYESSFCVKQSSDKLLQNSKNRVLSKEEIHESEEETEEAAISDEELSSYMPVDDEERFALDDDGQFSLELDF